MEGIQERKRTHTLGNEVCSAGLFHVNNIVMFEVYYLNLSIFCASAVILSFET